MVSAMVTEKWAVHVVSLRYASDYTGLVQSVTTFLLENISLADTNMLYCTNMCILLKDFLCFKKMPRHKYFRHLIIQGGPKMHYYFLAQ